MDINTLTTKTTNSAATDTAIDTGTDTAIARRPSVATHKKQTIDKEHPSGKSIHNTPPQALRYNLSKVKATKSAALSIRVDAHFKATSDYDLPFLSSHADSINARLCCLRAAVRINKHQQYCLSFQGTTTAKITADSVSQFLSALTDDLGIFLAYAQSHSLSLCEDWLQPCLETAMSVSNPVCYKVVFRK